ncbi:hypothetical protein CISG_10139 [Coccidioides immitis RMSCC 3703]|uniref:DNA replication factor Cdt1 C-terminal domain-containing protein n=1 Tax=Coccidioides immitis RMSCC 3703 TaxID=454286 RepID=A0A0J8QMK1_COCIT|nr:hypothetical protein CISG_10139 [Coccidioides immitis RMSCC 3703]
MSSRTLRSRAAKPAQSLLPPAKTTQAGIKGFTRTAKAGVGAAVVAGRGGSSSLKRKLQDADIEEITTIKAPVQERKTLKPGKTVSKLLYKPSASASVPKENAESIELHLDHDAPASETDVPVRETTQASPHTEHEPQSEYYHHPPSYNELTNLYSSFLKAVSLHLAHNGVTAAADLREFLPNMERVWKRRRVVTEDIQRLLYVENSGTNKSASFRLIDYGSRILLERIRADDATIPGHALDEDELNTNFGRSLTRILSEKRSAVSDFDCMRDLPLAPIYKIPKTFLSIKKQKASNIRREIVGLKTPDTVANVKETTPVRKSCTTERRNGLLERIRQKALRQSTLAPPISKETIMRRAAAARIPDIVGVLLLLAPSASTGLDMSPSHAKKAYKLDTIVQNIQDSMHNPVSKDEISTGLDILSRPEISGDWVTIVSVNSIKSVILRPSRNISPQEIKDKVEKLKL